MLPWLHLQNLHFSESGMEVFQFQESYFGESSSAEFSPIEKVREPRVFATSSRNRTTCQSFEVGSRDPEVINVSRCGSTSAQPADATSRSIRCSTTTTTSSSTGTSAFNFASGLTSGRCIFCAINYIRPLKKMCFNV